MVTLNGTFIALLVIACGLQVRGIQGYKRVCYYTNWSQWRQGTGLYTTKNVDPFLCTHIIFAFGSFNETGSIYAIEGNKDTNAFVALKGLKTTNSDLKLLLAFGGWTFGSTKFSNLVGNSMIRAKFVQNSIEFLRVHGFDGLDIDWEYPAQRGGVLQDKENFVTLCKELHDAFQQEVLIDGRTQLLLTAAVPASRTKAGLGYDVPALSGYFDFINLMTYDMHGSWESETGFNSPLFPSSTEVGNERYNNMNATAEWWNDAGMPKEKIVVGFAMYGRSFTLTSGSSGVGAPATGGPAGPFTKEAGFMAYYEICSEIESGQGQVVFDEEQKVPYFVKGTTWVGYDNEQSLRIKAQWLKSNGYGGVMFWSLDMDDFNQLCASSTRNYTLIRAVNDELASGSPSTTGITQDSNTSPTSAASTSQTQDSNTSPTTAASTRHTQDSNTSPTTPASTRHTQDSNTSPTTAASTRHTEGSMATETTTATTKLTTTSAQSETFTCVGKNGFYPDPKSCFKFYRCSLFQKFHFDCAPGLMFDIKISVCNWPSAVNCVV